MPIPEGTPIDPVNYLFRNYNWQREHGKTPWKPLWRPHSLLKDQFRRQEGDAFLYPPENKDPDVLHDLLIRAIRERGIPNSGLLFDAINFMRQVHEEEKRDDQVTPYSVHLLRVGLRYVLEDDIDPVGMAIALLHDAVENKGKTKEDFIDYLHKAHGHPEATAIQIYEGSLKLNDKRKKGRRQISTTNYYRGIESLDREHPEYHIWQIKLLDRLDNLEEDLAFAWEFPKKAVGKIKHYLPKIESLSDFITRNVLIEKLKTERSREYTRTKATFTRLREAHTLANNIVNLSETNAA